MKTMHYLLQSVLLAIACLLFPTLGYSADLLKVYELAVSNDPTLDAAKEAQLAARENIPQAKANFLPIVQGQIIHQANNDKLNNVNIANSKNSTPNSGPTVVFPKTDHFNQSTYSLSLTQAIPYYQEWVKSSKASSQVKAANATYAAAEQDLIVRTVTQYFEVLRAYDGLKFAIANRKALGKIYHQTDEQFKAGLIAITDTQIAKARFDNARADEIRTETNLINQKENLRKITVVPIEEYSFLRENLPLKKPVPENPEQWVKTAMDQNNALQASRFNVVATRKDVKINQAGHLPSLNVNANIERFSAIPGITSAGTDQYVNLQITLPIFSGGSVTSKTRQAAHIYGQTEKQMEVLTLQTANQTRQYYLGVITQISQINAYKQSILSNATALKASQESFNVGTRTIVDVLNSQRDLIEAQKNYANARYDYIVQSILLKQAAGTLNPEDVCHINAWLTESEKQHWAAPLPNLNDTELKKLEGLNKNVDSDFKNKNNVDPNLANE